MDQVLVVAYGDEAHLYEPDDESAEAVYTVAVGANLDVMRKVMTVERWQEVRSLLPGIEIHDHRNITQTDQEKFYA